MQILVTNFSQISFSNMSSKKHKYDESYMQYGFTSVIVGGMERPQCVLCNTVLSNDSNETSEAQATFAKCTSSEQR